MSYNRGTAIAWSAGVSAVAATFAGLLVSKATTPLSHNPWFIACLVVACVAFAILLGIGVEALVSWWRSRRPSQVAVVELREAVGRDHLTVICRQQPQTFQSVSE